MPPGYFAVDGTTIEVSQHNPPFEDVAEALTDSLPRDGSAPMTGNLPMGSNKITGLAAGTSASDAVRFDQLPNLTGLTATVTELNYTDGVTSPIQTQLNAKQATITTLPLVNGGTGSALVDPNADRILFWDDSAGAVAFLEAGSGLTISGTTITSGTWVNGAAVSTASGAILDIMTGLPANVVDIELRWSGVSLNGTDAPLIQLGNSGGYITTGYEDSGSSVDAAFLTSTIGLIVYAQLSNLRRTGCMRLYRLDTTAGNHLWASDHSFGSQTNAVTGGGRLTFTGPLTQIRIARTGSNSFSGGTIYPRYRTE